MSIQSEINRIAGAKSDIADAIEDKDVTVPSGTKLDGMANLIRQISGGSGKLNSTQAADAYDPTATYAVGDKVSYAGNVYSCISAISTPEAWDSTHWDQVDPIQDQVDDVRNTLNYVEDAIAYVQSGDTASRAYTAEEYVYLKNHPSLAEGLYTVNSGGIPIGTSVTGHLTADSIGGLNKLNALMSQSQAKSAIVEKTSATSHTFNVPSNSRHFFIASAASTDRDWVGFISASSNGIVTYIEMAKGPDVTQIQAGTNSITIGLGHTAGLQCIDFYIVGSKMT